MQVGIMLRNLGQNQPSFMAISFANTLIANHIHRDISLFTCETVSPVTKPLCLSTSIDRIHGFDGMLIATDLYLASLLNNVTAPKKLFYVWDLEWLRGVGNYVQNVKIMQNPELLLVARSNSHAAAIENYCNKKPDAIIPNFNLLTIVKQYEKN